MLEKFDKKAEELLAKKQAELAAYKKRDEDTLADTKAKLMALPLELRKSAVYLSIVLTPVYMLARIFLVSFCAFMFLAGLSILFHKVIIPFQYCFYGVATGYGLLLLISIKTRIHYFKGIFNTLKE